jgi:hypothetical protein
MALRATSGPALASRSVKAGDEARVAAKVENSASGAETVALFAEGLPEGAIAFEPPSALVPGKSRKALAFAWRAALPPGKDAHTYRGRLVLRHAATGQLVGEADLDLYVSR